MEEQIRRFVDVVKEDVKLGNRGEMEAGDWLLPPLNGKAQWTR